MNNEVIKIFREKCPLSILSSLSQGYFLVSIAVLVTQQSPTYALSRYRDIIYLLTFCYLFLYYCAINLIFDRHVISILAPRCVLHEYIFCSQCFVIKFYPIVVRCLKDTSWKVVTDQTTFTAISYKISTWMLEEMSRIKTSKNFMEHTSTSFSRRLFVCLI